MKNPFGWNYPAGAEHDPRAPWNQKAEPECQRCGETLRHDDDGPILCRFCDAAPDEDISSQAAAQAGWIPQQQEKG